MKLPTALLFAAAALALPPGAARASELVRTVAAVKPSVVGIGTWLPTRSPAIAFVGTGFVVGDGLSVVTNAHCVPAVLDSANRETFGIVLARGDGVEFRAVLGSQIDREHDLALLRLGGAPLPALAVGDSATAAEGQQLAFTGFPLGMVLGLHPVTHRALLAAITPIVMPALGAARLDARAIVQLQRPPLAIFQLDATAYPGNRTPKPVAASFSSTCPGACRAATLAALSSSSWASRAA